MREESTHHARILIVDDEPQNVRYLMDVLEWAGFGQVEGVTDPTEAVDRFRGFRPDLVILDLLMPGKDGFQVLEEIRGQIAEDEYLPVLILTGDVSREARRKALAAGARDFLTKPMSPTEVRFRVANLLETRFLYLESRRRGPSGDRLGARGESVASEEQRELLERWAASIEYRSGTGGQHAKRVSWLAAKLADSLGLEAEEVELIQRAALLHDLGTVASSNALLNRLEALNPDEHEALRQHPEAAAKLLEGSQGAVLQMAYRIAVSHRERWDGGGHPDGLAGGAIPQAARIVAVADDFDRLTFQGGRSREEALSLIEKESGQRFDPEVVQALLGAAMVQLA